MEDDENDLDNLFEEYENGEAPNEGNNENIENGNDPGTDDVPKTRVAPPRRAVKNPRLKFNPERLCGDRGIPVLVNHFKDVKFKGKGHEVEDLNKLLSNLEHWCHRLFPSMKFADCLKQIERLGKKRPVQTCLRKIRLDMPILAEDFIGEREENDREEMENEFEPDMPQQDAFDRLLSETPTSSYTPLASTPIPVVKTTLEHKLGTYSAALTEEQKKRMEYNKLLAVERRKAKLDAETSVETVLTDQSLESFKDIQESAFDNDAQFNSLLNHDNTIRNASISSPKQTIPSFSSLVDNSTENLELDDLVDLVDDEDKTIPLNINGNDAHPNNQHTVMVDLTNDDNNYSHVTGPTTTIVDLENEIIESCANESSHNGSVRNLARAEVVDLTESHNHCNKNRPSEVVDLEKETSSEDRPNEEIVLLDHEQESYNQSNALFMDTDEIQVLQETALTQHLNTENGIQSMDVE